jgi:phosphate uptake regulator
METRKLQRVGGGTYTVSIPKAWATEHGLEAGSNIHLYSHDDDSIVIRSSERDGEALDTIDLVVGSEHPELVSSYLRAAYCSGYNTVTLRPERSFTGEHHRAARTALQHLIGTELIVEREDEITVKNLLDATDVSIRQSVVQLQFVVLWIHEKSTSAFVDAEAGMFEQLEDRSAEAIRLSRMVTRHFNRAQVSFEELDHLGTSRSDLFDYYRTAHELKGVADLGVSIAQIADQLDEPVVADAGVWIDAAANASRELIDAAATAMLDKQGCKRAGELLECRDAAVDALPVDLYEQLMEQTGSDLPRFAQSLRVYDALLRTVGHGWRIADTAISTGIQAETR